MMDWYGSNPTPAYFLKGELICFLYRPPAPEEEKYIMQTYLLLDSHVLVCNAASSGNKGLVGNRTGAMQWFV